LTTPEAEEQARTAPIELAPEPLSPASAPPALVPEVAPEDGHLPTESVGVVAHSPQPQTLYVPLAVTIGDGFKFGCGFFLALVLAMLVGFVLLAALFVLTSLFGLNLPLTR
jgi:hypothetical protein